MPVYFESKKNKRRTNQDYHLYMEYRINHEAMIKTMLVADGMGGLACGELAASLAGEKWILKLQKLTLSNRFLGKSLNEQIEILKQFSYEVIQKINEEVYQELSDRGVTGGTTLSAAILFWDTLIFVNCGDSPAYFFSGKRKEFYKISKEQNAAEELREEGKVTKDSPEYVRHKNMLTDYIGKYRKAEPYLLSMTYEEGDCLLIGSDGAFGRLDDKELECILLKHYSNPELIVKEIIAEASAKGEEDNQTLLCYINDQVAVKEQKKEKRGLFRKRQVVKSCIL